MSFQASVQIVPVINKGSLLINNSDWRSCPLLDLFSLSSQRRLTIGACCAEVIQAAGQRVQATKGVMEQCASTAAALAIKSGQTITDMAAGSAASAQEHVVGIMSWAQQATARLVGHFNAVVMHA